MAMKCLNCGKGVQYGHNVSHAKNRTRKIFKPNLHSAKVLIGSVKKTVKLCTKCLRTVKKIESFSKDQDKKMSKEAITQAAPVATA